MALWLMESTELLNWSFSLQYYKVKNKVHLQALYTSADFFAEQKIKTWLTNNLANFTSHHNFLYTLYSICS
jgi:hypothetical protein